MYDGFSVFSKRFSLNMANIRGPGNYFIIMWLEPVLKQSVVYFHDHTTCLCLFNQAFNVWFFVTEWKYFYSPSLHHKWLSVKSWHQMSAFNLTIGTPIYYVTCSNMSTWFLRDRLGVIGIIGTLVSPFFMSKTTFCFVPVSGKLGANYYHDNHTTCILVLVQQCPYAYTL